MATTDVYNHDTQYDLQKTITLAEDFMNQEENLGRFHLNISIIPKDKNFIKGFSKSKELLHDMKII